MIINEELRNQLKPYLELLENPIVLKYDVDDSENGQKIKDFVTELASLSDKITVIEASLSRKNAFEIAREGVVSGLLMAGLPLGHEVNSLVLALVQVSGRPPVVEPELIERIKKIDKPLHFETYVSLTCHNCPDVVQAFNVMTVLNPNVSHTMIEGGMNQAEVEAKGIMAVPTVFHNNEEWASGRTNLEELLNKILGGADASEFEGKEYDVLVIGGGPAGAAASIYAARKGIRTGLLAERFGGQPLETLGIENLIGTPYIEGVQLGAQLENHVKQYDVDLMNTQRAINVEKKEQVEVTLENGAVLKTKALILATGAHWRDIGVPGEQEFKTKGVAYCPHCDGPLFAGKDVAVVGGGNSGIEAAIDLAGVVRHVTVLEFMDELKADKVLIEKVKSLQNVTILTSVATKEILGTDKVTGLDYEERESGEIKHLDLAGVFIQIGLVPNTEWLKDTAVELNARGEIVVDKNGQTNVDGIFAAGDVTDQTYKQIIISMGSGATAALSAFDYMIRN
ncbi:alkyl hydroperoxide reductase subunit F [Lactococcus termiticola]|uniref:Alkyl hydroperoxide reductase subunit F n=1 Tax=Lactococcus termiticola TaxID=2169526 RepID=A0A2R5HK80_9LACT|nr:alkyl hydroperoxide reductase subunit F [Lactococcus termiticola]GBG97168.1 alkyl hydroperoxide reductase subunit F [Lactococcus termiticola]